MREPGADLSPRAVGFAAIVVVLAIFVGGSVRIRRLAGASLGSPRAAAAAPGTTDRASAQLAAGAVAHLGSAVESLAVVEARRPRTAPPQPPDAFATPTACARTYLPEVELPEGSLDFLCEQTDAWTLERRMYEEIAFRRGEAARRWTRLGHYSLAALATIRSGCCAVPPPLRAVVPGLWCGILRDELGAFGPVPDETAAHPFDETMRCLVHRGVRLPERWDHVSGEQSRRAFDELWDIARDRGTVRN